MMKASSMAGVLKLPLGLSPLEWQQREDVLG